MSPDYRSYSDTHPELTPAEVAKHCGVHRDTVVRYRRLHGASKPQAAKRSSGKTLDDFRKQYDEAYKIREGIKRHLAADAYMTDPEFRDACGVHISRWRRYADEDEFRAYRIRVRSVLYWGSQSTIRAMRRIIGIPEEA